MIEAKNLTMVYGSTRALDRVSFKINEKEIVGLLGPNGAGKTTLMRILTTFIYPAEGTATVNGFDILAEPLNARKHLGYLPETPPLYTDMRVDEFMDFVGKARNLDGRKLKQRKDWVISACGISYVWKHKIHEISLGFRQRVGLAQALIHDPKVIILDEPTSGLDPIQIIGIRNLIRDLAKEKCILFSTHILQEASAISNRLFIINQGRIVAQGTTAELQSQGSKEELLVLKLGAGRAEAENALNTLKCVKRAVFMDDSGNAPRFSVAVSSYEEAVRAIHELIQEKNWVVKELSPYRASLEDVFVNIFKKTQPKDKQENP